MENINLPPKPIGTLSPFDHRFLRLLLYPSANHLSWPSATISISHRHKSITTPVLGHILLFHHRYEPSSATLLSISHHFIRLPIYASLTPRYASKDTCPKTVSTGSKQGHVSIDHCQSYVNQIAHGLTRRVFISKQNCIPLSFILELLMSDVTILLNKYNEARRIALPQKNDSIG